MEEIKVNLDNLTNEERETLLKLVEKGNRLNKHWRGKVNDSYYMLSNRGNTVRDVESGCACDEQSYRLGNYFKTEEEAVFARDKQLVYQKLKDYALEHNTEEIDWENKTQKKWYIYFDCKLNLLRGNYNFELKRINEIYFTSAKIAENAIKEIGENKIKKYLFGVEE